MVARMSDSPDPEASGPQKAPPPATIRTAGAEDVAAVSAIDAAITGLPKPDYWRRAFTRYGAHRQRHFLVAEAGGRVVGFIIGEERAWEFGSPPCGWVFAIGVDPAHRQGGIGTRLFDAICRTMHANGMSTVRTMLARDDALNMAFFRSQGMTGGPFIQLEMPLGQEHAQGPRR